MGLSKLIKAFEEGKQDELPEEYQFLLDEGFQQEIERLGSKEDKIKAAAQALSDQSGGEIDKDKVGELVSVMDKQGLLQDAEGSEEPNEEGQQDESKDKESPIGSKEEAPKDGEKAPPSGEEGSEESPEGSSEGDEKPSDESSEEGDSEDGEEGGKSPVEEHLENKKKEHVDGEESEEGSEEEGESDSEEGSVEGSVVIEPKEKKILRRALKVIEGLLGED